MEYWSWLPLKAIAAACRRWHPVAAGVISHETELSSPRGTISGSAWSSTGSRSRTRPGRTSSWISSPPDDGHYDYSAVATNLPLGLPALWAFACGRGAQEKTFAELKGEFALDVVPT